MWIPVINGICHQKLQKYQALFLLSEHLKNGFLHCLYGVDGDILSIHIASSIRGGQYDDPVLVHLLNIIYTRRGIHLISQTHIFHIDSSSHFRPQIHFMNIISAHRGINLISCTHIYIHIWSNLTVLQIMSWTWDWLVVFYQKHLNPNLNHTVLVTHFCLEDRGRVS